MIDPSTEPAFVGGYPFHYTDSGNGNIHWATEMKWFNGKMAFVVNAQFWVSVFSSTIDGNQELWFANSRSKLYRFSYGPYINRGQFCDRLKTEYPEHFEWFLWHPEYL
jgi:hypothetical protein